MRLPFDLLTQNYTKPQLFLCETDKTRICELSPIELSGSFKFNAYDELRFSIGRTYINLNSGQTETNPFYDKIEALRLVYLDGFGYFEIQEPEIVSDGIKEIKNVTAYGLEYSLSQKYLEEMYVNTGDANSIEVIQGGGVALRPIQLYDTTNTSLSLLHIVLQKIYGWTIGHVDESLKTMTRTFEIDRASVYDFITQDICDKFNCYAVFDTIENKINLYAEALITKFVGDGKTTDFVMSTPYDKIGSVTIGGYPTTEYVYNTQSGVLTFNEAPENGEVIEVVDGSQNEWKTDVYVTFDNLAQEAQVNYSADDIKTVLTVKGADDLDIREVNMGNPYIVDLSYYYSVEWMGKELYDAYTAYLQKCNESQLDYKSNAEAALEIKGHISYEENRLSLRYTVANNIVSTTVGTYYVRGGSDPNYYYTEVSLPEEFNSQATYYSLHSCHLNEDKVSKLYDAITAYYMSEDEKNTSDIDDLEEDFEFMVVNTIPLLSSQLKNAANTESKDLYINNFLNEMWDQIGRSALLSLYYTPYVQLKETNEDAGWNHPENENYMSYHVTSLFVNSIDVEAKARDEIITQYNNEYMEIQNENKQLYNSILMDVFFENYYIDKGCSQLEAKQKAMKLLVRISPFLREDEYVDDNFIETDSDTTEVLMNTKQALLECGRIELARISSPSLSFSMDMANIFALKEFDPIIYQFQLGKLINVVLRPNYIKRARLLAVNINFNDFSDFSCEFGELTSLKTPSSIHADLLSTALIAGKSVASNASYWSKGADLATSTYQKIQQGLLDATAGIYSSDQGVIIDKQGIKLTKVIDAETGEVHPAQAWLRNNMILLTDDGWKTARTGLGEFTIGNRTFYGLLADAMLAGYIEGSEIVGGTINIGNGNFVVDVNGVVTMRSEDNNIEGYAKTDYVENRYSTLEKTIDGFRTTVGNTYSTKEEVSGVQSALNNQINDTNQNVSAISNRVASAETNIVQNADAIKLSATKTEVQTLNTNLQGQINTANTVASNIAKRVTTAETSIAQNSDSITSLATRTTANENGLSGVTGRISTAETKITQNADSITSLASRTSTVENKFGNYSTTAQMNSAIKQSADSISSTVSSTYATKTYVDGQVDAVETRVGSAETSISQNTSAIALRATKTEVDQAIDKIVVGGKNLIIGSSTADISRWYHYGWGGAFSTLSSQNRTYRLTNVNGWRVYIYDLTNYIGQQITISADFMVQTSSTNTSPIVVQACNRTANTNTGSQKLSTYKLELTNNGAWYHFSTTMTVADGYPYLGFYIRSKDSDSATGTSYIDMKNVKFEKGNKETDWTPAPEDIEARVTTAEASITTNAGNIELKASKTELTNAISAITVGGRNIALNTRLGYSSTTTVNNTSGYTYKNEDVSVPSGYYCSWVVPSVTTSTYRGVYWYYTSSIGSLSKLISGETYTISFWAKASSTGLSLLPTSIAENQTIVSYSSSMALGTSWKKYFVTFKYTNTSKFTMCFYCQDIASSAITISMSSLMLELGNKASDWSPAPEDVVGKTEVVSAINLSPENIKIKSDKIQLEGFVSVNEAFSIDEEGDMIANSGKIGGFDITDGSLECDIIEDFSSFKETDKNKIRDYILGDVTLTDAEKDKYDVCGNYDIGATDLLYVNQMINGSISKVAKSKMSINLNSARDAILLEGVDGFKKGWKTRIGVGGIRTRSVTSDDLACNRILAMDGSTKIELPDTSVQSFAPYVFSSESESDETNLDIFLNDCLNIMPNNSQAPCFIKCYPAWGTGCDYQGTLYKSNNNYAVWVGWSYELYGKEMRKAKYNGTWMKATPMNVPASIELNLNGQATDHGGYIDFHWGGTNSDWTSRIIEGVNGGLDLKCPNGLYVNGYKAWSAIYTGSSSSCGFTTSIYDFIIVLASPASGYTPMSCVIPAYNVGSNFQVADEANFTKFALNANGITRVSGTGMLISVWGVILT